MIRKEILNNGLTVVTESMPYVRSVAVEWRAGGVGYPDGVTTAGAELLVWRHDEGRWWDVEVRHDAGPDAPATLRWSGDDAAVLPQLFGGAGRSVYVAVVPRAVSGPGSRDGGARRARVATDWLGVTVRYDLGFPAHDTCAGPAEPQPDGDGVWRLAGHLGRARDTTAGSCSGLGAASDLVFLAELEAGAWVVTRRAGGPLTVYLRRAGCADGEEVACVTLAGDAGPAEAELGELEAGATWVFVESAEPGEFELGLAQVEAPGGGGS